MAENLNEYELGARDERIWGTWEVIANPVKEGDIITQCEKEIVVYPQQMLSLQAHTGRSELWRVEDGTLTVVFNDEVKVLGKGQEIELPVGTIHAMVNTTDKPVKVYEKQYGRCEEADNIRLMDMGGRDTTDIDHPALPAARTNYKKLMDQIKCG